MSDNPNVLLITTDHWPNSLLGVSGHSTIQTPTLDSLARAGTRFSRGYSECPVCVPARKTLMTGTTARTHKDRVFNDRMGINGLPTVAQTFQNAGYQAYAVGKLHVYPQRDRIGFDDVMLGEEGRTQYGVIDDYELFLGDKGYAGQQFAHGMCNNDYLNRPWHLPEDCHVTNWSTDQMVRMIKRRDPTRPGFWYLSYCHPHPPLAPLQCYMDMYRNVDVEMPYHGEWSTEFDKLPLPLKSRQMQNNLYNDDLIRSARQAFYALCTHIDHQLRLVIGTLREEGLLNDTIILFTSDHGDMLGNHKMWAKRLYYEDSTNVPMLLVGTAGDDRVGHNRVDDRLVGWQDVMPTLLHLAGIEIPNTVEGIPMVSDKKREWLYGEIGEGGSATRMIHEGRYKLIYYATGNYRQLFDLEEDPRELNDLSESSAHAGILERLTNLLIHEFYGGDLKWIQDGKLVGLPDGEYRPSANRNLSGQRGLHWPQSPSTGR